MRHSTVSIPYILALQIDEILESYGYRSRSEFASDACRRLLGELQSKEKLKETRK